MAVLAVVLLVLHVGQNIYTIHGVRILREFNAPLSSISALTPRGLGIFLSLAAFLVAAWADDHRRRGPTAAFAAVAAAAMFVFAFATTGVQLIGGAQAFNIGVAVVTPLAVAWVTDATPLALRGRALEALAVASGMGSMVVGATTDILAWNQLALGVGALALVLAPTLFLLGEPARKAAPRPAASLHRWTIFGVMAVFALFGAASNGLSAWIFEANPVLKGQLNIGSIMLMTIAGLAGTVAGAWLGERWVGSGAVGGRLRVALLAFFGFAFGTVMALRSEIVVAWSGQGLRALSTGLMAGVVHAAVQDMVTTRTRARTAALLAFTQAVPMMWGVLAIGILRARVGSGPAILWVVALVCVMCAGLTLLLIKPYDRARLAATPPEPVAEHFE